MAAYKMYGKVDGSNIIIEFKMLWEGAITGMTLLKNNCERNERGNYQLKKSVDGIEVHKWKWNTPNIDEISDISAKNTNEWKNRKKAQLREQLQGDFKGQKENKYQNLKLKKLDSGTLTQAELDHIAAFESFRTTRLAQYETDKTTHGIT